MAKAATAETVEEMVIRMRNDGDDWATIAAAAGIGAGKAWLIVEKANTDPKDLIKFKDEDDLAKKVVAARGNGLSWGIISARTDVPESKLRSLFEAAGGGSARGHRIGKGGRYPAESNGAGTAPATKAAAKKAPATKKTAATKAAPAAAGAKVGLGDMTLAQLKQRLDGKTITVDPQNGGKAEKIGVVSVMRIKDGELTFKEVNGGKTRTVLLTQVKGATK